MESWVAQELATVELGDGRRTRRLVRLMESLAERPATSVPRACGDWAATKGAYRLWASPQVTREAIMGAHADQTAVRLAGHALVLALQDTTSLDFTHHPRTTGLGPLESPTHRGFLQHTVLMASDAGVPLGVLHQQLWARDPAAVGQRHQRRQRTTAEKESQRWLTAEEATRARVPAGVAVVTVADREADIYDFLALPRRPGETVLIRATHNRRVREEAGHLWQAISASPCRGTCQVEVQRHDEHPSRVAVVQVRFTSTVIEPPGARRGRSQLAGVPVSVVLAEEEAPPEGIAPLRWLLITTRPVETWENALQCLQWYRQRWLIERYHYVLKSGCQVERLELRDGERLQRALATYSIVAWRLLWLTYEARVHPDQPCTGVLAPTEWQSLYCVIHKTPAPPTAPMSLAQAVRWIAQLGGFLGRRSDGNPGVKALWRGLLRLHDLALMWSLTHPLPAPPSSGPLVGNA